MRKAFLFFSVMAGLFITCSVSQATLIGSAADYNVFLFGDMNVWTSDAEGRVAVGGNISMSSYSIGLKAEPAEYSIVGGGNVNFGPGSVLNGGIFAEGNINLHNFGVYGDVTTNGTITRGSGRSGGTITGSIVQNPAALSPINFVSEYGYLHSTSLELAAMPANGITYVNLWSGISLTGTEDVNIFSIDGKDLTKASSLTFNIGADDIAIVNVSGDIDNFSKFGIFGYDGKKADVTLGNIKPGNILYNFYDADQLTIGGIGIEGSILAPDAIVIFNSGHIDGTLIAHSLTGTGQSNLYLFDHDLFDHDVPEQPVPEPATVILLGCGLAGAFILRKKISLKTAK